MGRPTTRQRAAGALTFAAVGAKVEVKTRDPAWFPAVVKGHQLVRGRMHIMYETLAKDGHSGLPETGEVSGDEVRPEPPLSLTHGQENEDPGFEMHDLVEAYRNGGWWYDGVISGLRNAVTGEYRVSFPVSGETIEFSPSQIRPQFNFINGSWFPLRPKSQKKRGRPSGKQKSASAKKKKNDISIPASGETSFELKKCSASADNNENCLYYERRKGVSKRGNPNPNPNQVLTLPNPNPSSSSGDTVLPFERISLLCDSVLDTFKKIPQSPHFANLQRCCNKEEIEGRALAQMVNYSNLVGSIKTLAPNAELAELAAKLDALDSYQKDGFETDPFRAVLASMVELKKEAYQRDLRREEIESELTQRQEDRDEALRNVDRIDAELADLRERERRLEERRERELERSVGNVRCISELESELIGLDRDCDVVSEKLTRLCGDLKFVRV